MAQSKQGATRTVKEIRGRGGAMDLPPLLPAD